MAHAHGYDFEFAEGDAREPALVLLHGTGDNARAFLEFGRQIAPRSPLISVQGNVDEAGMARFFRRHAMGVYDMADLEARTEALASFLEHILPRHGLSAGHTVGVGYSNGANILANLLFRRPTALARYTLLHPLIPFTPPMVDLAGRRVLITAGERDPIAPPAATWALAAALEARGATVTVETHGGGHELRPEELAAATAFVRETSPDQPVAP